MSCLEPALPPPPLLQYPGNALVHRLVLLEYIMGDKIKVRGCVGVWGGWGCGGGVCGGMH